MTGNMGWRIKIGPHRLPLGGNRDTKEFDACLTEQLNDIRTLAQALGLQGTPAFIIGDYVIPGADLDAVKAALAKVKGQNLKRPPATAPGSPT